MDKLLIDGPSALSGMVNISCSKNAYLPIMAAIILNPNPVTLFDLPDLRDVRTMKKLLSDLGVKISQNENETIFDSSDIKSLEATYELVKTMRASILVLGPLLARFNKALVSLPGGCAIGSRPVDIHLDSFAKMNASIGVEGGYAEVVTLGLKGSQIVLPFPSVGATENIMMSAVLAKGKTVIKNAAMEPEIVDLASFLRSMGAIISGDGTTAIEISGIDVSELKSTKYRAIPDRIEAGTYIMAALATNSEIVINNCEPKHLEMVLELLEKMGANLKVENKTIKVIPSLLKGANIETSPYPGFPTDLQAQIMTLTLTCDGPSVITENIFENRFMHVPELNRLGANIKLKGKSAYISGKKKLKGAPIMCTDLRASAALLIAGMMAKGTSDIQRVYHLDRGYEKIDQKLFNLGVKIKRSNDYIR